MDAVNKGRLGLKGLNGWQATTPEIGFIIVLSRKMARCGRPAGTKRWI
jgi:hypothetical protein